jgi:class 3 adenylate cyclase
MSRGRENTDIVQKTARADDRNHGPVFGAADTLAMERPPVSRRLAAIVVADVVGYTRLMERDEDGTHSLLQELRAELIEPKVAEFG